MPALASQRDRLLDRYRDRVCTNAGLDRSVVSFQANRKEPFFGWLKYKEGFSAALARDMIERFCPPGGAVLDPFAGVGTAAFVACDTNRPATAIELLPVGAFAMEARQSARAVTPATMRRHVDAVAGRTWSDHFDPTEALRHIPISHGAFSGETERAIAGYRAHCRGLGSAHVRRLFHLACLAILESVSFTRKDGQYLRWDRRARRSGLRTRFSKGGIPSFDDRIDRQLQVIAADLEHHAAGGPGGAAIDLRQGSCLDILPVLPDGSVDLVLTSPPYCNRYDYTRTYALELVYLGLDQAGVKALRQTMLSCTVENADKLAQLKQAYDRLGRGDAVDRAVGVFEGQAALHEVLDILEDLGGRRALNNASIPRMVRNYFAEMCLVILELTRLLRPGGRVVMVNDNVRYAGQEVPVDLILSDCAARLGLTVEHIWALPRGKGNSSQQMGAHGRQELRKGVYVWRK